MDDGLLDVATTLKQCEDHLFSAMRMSLRERSIYYYLFRHTRLLGKETGLFAIDPLAAALERIRQPVERETVAEAWCSAESGLAQQDGHAGQLDKGEEVASVVLVAGYDPPEAEHPGEEALDVPAAPVAPQWSPVLGLSLSSRVVGRDHLDPALGELGVEPVAVVGHVADELLG